MSRNIHMILFSILCLTAGELVNEWVGEEDSLIHRSDINNNNNIQNDVYCFGNLLVYKMQERNQIFNLLPPLSGLEASFHSPSRQLPLWVCKSEDKKIPDDI